MEKSPSCAQSVADEPANAKHRQIQFQEHEKLRKTVVS